MKITATHTVKVRNVHVGDVLHFLGSLVIVDEIKENRVLVHKLTAQPGHGIFAIMKSSPEYEDLENRVKYIGTI